MCGQVRFWLTAMPIASRVCWCKDCQRIASNGTANLIVPTAAMEISGTFGKYTHTVDSGNQVIRRFCPQCGTQLFADSTGRVGATVVRVGTLDDPSSVRPSADIWSSSAPAWACLDAALERVGRQPGPPPAKAG